MNETEKTPSTPVGTWLFQCGCGNEVRVKNQTLLHSLGPCPSCLSILADDIEVSVPAELDWCGCGSPEAVDTLMLRYLSAIPHYETGGDGGLSENEYLLLAYIADRLEWTEHGGSIYGAWLTDAGKEALAALRERADENPPSTTG